MAILYDNSGDNRERIEKARAEVERLAQERVHRGLDKSLAEARVGVYKRRRDLTEILWDAPPPEPEPEEQVDKSAQDQAADKLMEEASILLDRDPSLRRQDAILEACKKNPKLASEYFGFEWKL